LTLVTDVKAGAPVHAALSGPNRLKVMLPVGVLPPASVAVSVTVPPTTTGCEAVVDIVGVTMAAVTTTDSPSVRQPLMGVAPLLRSPLYNTCHR
jgi:hypothetical protein